MCVHSFGLTVIMLIVDNQKESELPYWVKPILGVAITSKRILQKSMVEEHQRLDAIQPQGFFKLSCANSYTIAPYSLPCPLRIDEVNDEITHLHSPLRVLQKNPHIVIKTGI